MTSASFAHLSDVEGTAALVPTPYNHQRLRSDTWNRLRDAARRLRSADADDPRRDLLRAACAEALETLRAIERYHAFPGWRLVAHLHELHTAGRAVELATACIRVLRMMSTESYRQLDFSDIHPIDALDLMPRAEEALDQLPRTLETPYFELMVVDDIDDDDEMALRARLHGLRDPADHFHYELVVVRTFEDAVLAALLNPHIAACVLRFSFPFQGRRLHALCDRLLAVLGVDRAELAALMPGERTEKLGQILHALRPELDLFRVTSAPIESLRGSHFRRIFYLAEDVYDLHVSVLRGIHDRFETPFFEALRRYSERPTGMFHALPVSRARTIANSHWIGDFGQFYGQRLFFAETSATTGGLDSLLQPTGSLKRAQELAARAFGAYRTFYVTNGTSTANKIVMQALCQPDDIILLSHDCHKSHPYATILSGANPVYLDAYPLTECSMYGGVSLEEIKRQLLRLRRAGRLDQVRLLLLTNLTFDGITYDPYRIMKEVLAIKPDILFLWDEAWFAYGRFSPLLRRRTAMDAARRLERDLASPAYRARYAAWKKAHDQRDPEDDATWLAEGLMPDPDRARVRVYATQSTHKTLTALRQGSMIHVRDVDFERRTQASFHEAYMTHTSTSPNYQILASLDVGRRQVELEGYELVSTSLELAFTLRRRINQDALLSRYFRALTPAEMIPSPHRRSGVQHYFDAEQGLGPIERAYVEDEFVLDPTRVTLHVGRTGRDGDAFKKLLMDRYDVHINKTSRNTVLLLIHIGVSRGAIAHLVKVLSDIARDLDTRARHASPAEQAAFDAKVASLTEKLPPLPNFSHFHPHFQPEPGGGTPEGDIRRAYFAAYDAAACQFVPLNAALREAVAGGRQVVSASFVTPYPPGFPVLVPGQVMSVAILDYLLALDVKEIHGLNPELGLRVFDLAALAMPAAAPAADVKPPTHAETPPPPRRKSRRAQRPLGETK
ncbi:MAG: hypothetical protein KC620_06175 [Myxococcales bacterium]|nr:hypothetical protein [Myxococcales bacterium]